MFNFYFLIDQGVVKLTLRVLGLVKTILLKTFVDCFYGKDKKLCLFVFIFYFFYRGITLAGHPMGLVGCQCGIF
jgi:hypothetical protein